MKNQYMSYQESLDFLHMMEKQYPDLIEIIKIGTTYEGRDIVLAKISRNVEKADEKPALLYTGSIHAREWIGHELALKFITHVAENRNVDPVLEKALDVSTLYSRKIQVPTFMAEKSLFQRQRPERSKHLSMHMKILRLPSITIHREMSFSLPTNLNMKRKPMGQT